MVKRFIILLHLLLLQTLWRIIAPTQNEQKWRHRIPVGSRSVAVEWLSGHLVLGPHHLMPVFLQEIFKQEISAPSLDLSMRILMISTSDAYRED